MDTKALAGNDCKPCESGGGVSCAGKGAPKQAFLGCMLYNRFWFHNDLFGFTL
ncbi:MAG: hypothetical protein JWP08_1900, partial [Bryobacterales bacterium]|nr:hypothetical protein [Bryobacterales bacterium]